MRIDRGRRRSVGIRSRARGRFFNLVDLVNQLEQEKAAGRSGRLSEKLLRHDLIVIDELLKRQLSLPVSMMSQWCVSRSSMAVVILASPNTCGQSAKARLVVISSDVFS
jgi:DNA replication protein DnaC